MYLKSVTVKGFKSFPDRTRLEFGPGVSVIVGPNGSGKSNVTDAVLWALGEQSPVAVRGQSMQDVIFGGAPGRKAASTAEVELVLDDSEQSLGLGVSEISIVRPSILPLRASRRRRSPVDAGSMSYSAVTQPLPRPIIQRGTCSSTLAVHSTRVSPHSVSTDA